MPTVESAVLKATVSAARFLMPQILERHRINKALKEVRPIQSDKNRTEMLECVPPAEATQLHRFLHSPEFENLALSLAILTFTHANEDDFAMVRAGLRQSIKLTLGETENLFEVTDVIYNLLLESVHQVLAASGTIAPQKTPPTLLAAAAKVAAASARNATLLERIKQASDIEHFVSSLQAQIKEVHGTMRLPHAGLNKSVPYSRIYIKPQLKPVDTIHAESNTEPTDIASILNTRKRFVVLGDPGAGKSTLAAKLAYDATTNKRSAPYRDYSGVAPFLISLRDHATTIRESPSLTVIDLIIASCNRPHHIFPTRDTVEYCLLNGKALVIIDGVDELGEVSCRHQLALLVEGFAARYPLAQVVVTSRSVGYKDAALDPNAFPAYTISPFNVSRVHQYAAKWFTAAASAYTQGPQELTTAFMEESGANADDLRRNPLILALLCGMYASTRYIPRNRPEIYEKCAEMLFERWDRSRGINVPLRFSADIRPAVQQLAWKLLTDNKARVALPRSEILRALTEYLKSKRYEDEDEAAQAAQDFLDFCAGRAWALSEVGTSQLEPLYGFSHRTFLEYFAASRLVRYSPSASSVWQAVQGKLDDSSWLEVALLATQILDRTVEDQASQLLELAVTDQPNTASLSFAANSLKFISPTPHVLRRIIAEAVSNVCSHDLSRRVGWFDQPADFIAVVDSDDIILALANAGNHHDRRISRLLADELVSNYQEDAYWLDDMASFLWAASSAWTDTTRGIDFQLFCDELSQFDMPHNVKVWMSLLNTPTRVDEYFDILDTEVSLKFHYAQFIYYRILGNSSIEQLIGKAMGPDTIDDTAPARLLIHKLAQKLTASSGHIMQHYPATALDSSAYPHVFTSNQLGYRALPPETRGDITLLTLPYLETLATLPAPYRVTGTPTMPSIFRKLTMIRSSQTKTDGRKLRSIIRSGQIPAELFDPLWNWITHEISYLEIVDRPKSRMAGVRVFQNVSHPNGDV